MILHMIVHKYHIEFVAIVPEPYQVYDYLFSFIEGPDYWTVLKIASFEIIVDDTFGFQIRIFWNSDQSVKLLSSFETAGTNMFTGRQTIVYDDSQGLDWFFRSEYGIVVQFHFSSMSPVGFGDNTINWNFAGFVFIPILPNQYSDSAVIE